MRYIGIDIGDGESAAAMLQDTGAALPQIVTLGGYQSLLSVVGTKNGMTKIGQSALLTQGIQDLDVRFKSRYLTDTGAYASVARFAQGLRMEMAAALQGGEYSIALGCPAGWTGYDRERYADLVRGAGFSNLRPVAESRAAFLYAHYDQQIGLSETELSQPTLVIDIGSSTTDFAYIVDGRESNVGVFGANHLGGGQLDRLILDMAVKESPDASKIQAMFQDEKFSHWRNLCEMDARELKETYFTDENLWASVPCTKETILCPNKGTRMLLMLSLDREKIDRILNTPLEGEGSQSFLERLWAYLEFAREKTAANPPQQVILTGGASRMGFFQKACRDAFPQANIILCQEPEFSIARGLSIAARIDDLLRLLRKNVENFFQQGSLMGEIQTHLPALLEKLIPVLASQIVADCVDPVLASHKSGTIAQVQAAIMQRVSSEFNGRPSTPEVQQVMSLWIGEYLGTVQKQLDDICNQSKVEPADLCLAKLALHISLKNVTIPMTTWIIHKLPNLPIFKNIGHSAMRKRVEESLKQDLSNPAGVFVGGLAGGLETELRAQIEKNIEKVEVRIA